MSLAPDNIGFESQAIQNYNCDMKWPICIYDFTFRMLVNEYICYKVGDYNLVIEDYFNFSTHS